MPKGRCMCAAARIGCYIYVVGGEQSTAAYSLDTEKWVSKTPMKKRRLLCAIVASNGRLYVFGECDDRQPEDTAEVYDPVTDEWEHLPRMSQARRYIVLL